jgi:hypothetical protein
MERFLFIMKIWSKISLIGIVVITLAILVINSVLSQHKMDSSEIIIAVIIILVAIVLFMLVRLLISTVRR